MEYVAVEDQIERLNDKHTPIPHDLSVLVGEILLSSDPKYFGKWKYLYRNLSELQKAIDSNIKNLLAIQKMLATD